ncbi:dipeptidase [Sphingopyxis sp. USTB-05]|uniref:dipeptidase n=1 Tax=Sphingopyxis sp. USTB-05 TaxID=2830667 RepID=UPI002078A04A|nr:dipeptidase [Sphingopyxis sp. USTB-05]USI77630.1 dipeptidase [Sphingopyxis sp. USTB-05]
MSQSQEKAAGPLMAMEIDHVSDHARRLLRESFVWDAHGGFTSKPDQNLNELSRWEKAGVDFLSVNIGFDVHPWEFTVQTVAAYRHWIAHHPDRFVLVESMDDVFLAKREGKLAIAFDLEGAVSLGNQLSMLALYHRLGVRQMHFVYNLNNEAGGGCQDDDQGLTDFGRALVDEVNRLGILLDMSHVGYRSTMEIMERSKKPVVFSHSNPRALVDHPRNLTDEQMLACAATGGLIGVTGVGRFLGDPEARSSTFVKAIDLAVERVGIDAVGIGLDFVWAPGGPSRFPQFWPPEYYTGKFAYLGPHQLPEITEMLLRKGYDDADIRKIFGENYLRVAGEAWDVGFVQT